MAQTSSGELSIGSSYTLGKFVFSLAVEPVSGSESMKYTARCQCEGKSASKTVIIPGNASHWYIEANETEATAYVSIPSPGELKYTEVHVNTQDNNNYVRPYRSNAIGRTSNNDALYIGSAQSPCAVYAVIYNNYIYMALKDPASLVGSRIDIASHKGMFCRWGIQKYFQRGIIVQSGFSYNFRTTDTDPQGRIPGEQVTGGEYLVGRFSINLAEAGGGPEDPDGGGGGWDEPGDYDPWEDEVDPDEEEDLFVELDQSDGRPGDTFTASITGHRMENVSVTVSSYDGVTKGTYQASSPSSKASPVTVSIPTDISWLSGSEYSVGFYVEARTSTGRTASDCFYLEKDWLNVDIDPWDGSPGDVLTAIVTGHNGTDVSGTIQNAAGETVLTISPITPQDAETEIEIPITLNSNWFSTADTFCESLVLVITSADGQTVEAGFSMSADSGSLDPEEDLFIELDEYYGEPGDTFIVSITGHRTEAMGLTIYDSEGTVAASYGIQAPSDKADVATQSFQTATGWMPSGTYSASFTVEVETVTTGRKAYAGFTLSYDSSTIDSMFLSAEVDPYEGRPEETLTATVTGHNGTTVTAVIQNSSGDTIETFSPITPTDAQTAVEIPINLNYSWFSQQGTYCEAFMIVVTSEDGQKTSAGFSMVIEPGEPYTPPAKTLHLTVTGATSGTHEDASFPKPNESIAYYGCGGNGGYGGGGGAGASTIVVHKFATGKAGSKEVTATAREPGVGSGGGKGGKGGSGIILIYY